MLQTRCQAKDATITCYAFYKLDMILSFIDTIGNVLEAHYNVVCYLGSLIYNTHVATTNLLSAVGQGIRDFYYVVGSILTDTFLLLLMILKHMVLGVRIIWTGLFITLNFVETTILWVSEYICVIYLAGDIVTETLYVHHGVWSL